MGEFLTSRERGARRTGAGPDRGPDGQSGLFPGHQTFGEEGSRMRDPELVARVQRSGAGRSLRSLRASYRVPRMAPASYQEPVKD